MVTRRVPQAVELFPEADTSYVLISVMLPHTSKMTSASSIFLAVFCSKNPLGTDKRTMPIDIDILRQYRNPRNSVFIETGTFMGMTVRRLSTSVSSA
jgi:hypothetical protein